MGKRTLTSTALKYIERISKRGSPSFWYFFLLLLALIVVISFHNCAPYKMKSSGKFVDSVAPPIDPPIDPPINPDFNIDYGASRLQTRISPFNFTHHVTLTDEPSWIESKLEVELHEALQRMETEYVELFLRGCPNNSQPTNGATCGLDYISSSPVAELKFNKLDQLIDQVLKYNFKPYIRYQAPGWILAKYDDMDCSSNKIAELGPLYEAITKHLYDKYGEQTWQWIFSFDNERGVDQIGDYHCANLANCWPWTKGSEMLAEYTHQLAGRIKKVSPKLRVAAWESFRYYNWYLIKHLIGSNKTHLLDNIDIISTHGYISLELPADAEITDSLRAIDAQAGPEVWNTEAPTDGSAGATHILLNTNNLSRIKLWFGENNLNSSSSYPKNSGVEGGLYYALSFLRLGQSGVEGQVHWWNIDSSYGFIGWDGVLLDNYYAFLLLSKKFGFRNSMSYHEISPDNSALFKNKSPIRIFAISNEKTNALVIFNISETKTSRQYFSVKSPNPAPNYVLDSYMYGKEMIKNTLENMTRIPIKKEGESFHFSLELEALSMYLLILNEN